MRLRRSDPNRPGYGRRRSGKGFRYLDTDGSPLTDAEAVDRIRALVIPPAWTEVWICPDPRGHLQATGYDSAGRKQYLYHPVWRSNRDEAKFDHALEVAERLPELRDRLRHDLVHGRGLRRERVLAAVVSLLDMGMFRVGGAAYADRDEDRRWREVDADTVNEYLREIGGEEMTAKDFRTWHGTVTAARSLAVAGPRGTKSGRAKVVSAAMKEVAEKLGNTPAVARGSYVDPRVVERYHAGEVADVDPGDSRSAAEQTVLDMLTEP